MGQRFEHAGACRAGRVCRDQPDRFVQVFGVVSPAKVVLQMAAGLQEERGANRFGDGIDLPQRGRSQHEPAVILPGQFRDSYRLLQHRAMIGADPLRGVRHLIPKLEHSGQHRELLGVRQRTAWPDQPPARR